MTSFVVTLAQLVIKEQIEEMKKKEERLEKEIAEAMVIRILVISQVTLV